MTLLRAQDFWRLEPGNPGPSQASDWCVTDARDWGRFFTRAVYTAPCTVVVDVQVHALYPHRDARPYDGVSFLWGAPAKPNDHDYNINLMRREQGPNRWHEEEKGKYRWRSPESQMVRWAGTEVRTFQIEVAPPKLSMWSDGVEWVGHDPETHLTSALIGIRADRCLAQWRVHVYEGAADMGTRISGQSRYHTAVAISRTRFPAGAAKVYLASGTNFPDALAAAPMALDGPLLYAKRDELPAVTAAEINRLGPDKIVVLGGRGVISDQVLAAADAAKG